MKGWVGKLDRLKEPSTWAGIAVLLAMGGVVVPVGAVEVMAQLSAAVAALAAIIVREKA